MRIFKHQQWHVFYLGGINEDEPKQTQTLQDCQFLERPIRQISAQAVAYHGSFYDQLLKDIPSDEESDPWAKSYESIDQYLHAQENLIVMSPVIIIPAKMGEGKSDSAA